MTCTQCGKELKLVSEYQNPDVAAGHKRWTCEDHPNVGEEIMWYCPYIPLVMKQTP